MTSNEFIHHFVSTHLALKTGKPRPQIPGYDKMENRWLALHGLGKHEPLATCTANADQKQILYNGCTIPGALKQQPLLVNCLTER
ncbi:hypothetical protein LL912_04670 [Niabella sp. CC-SYL272]|uniref:hypothetical protein n=1 Tax=Niabella agricola TaxID=2891571 RepID=UPI001F189756|nr:hypothetical protein [Niabella agricola]MCF3108065.1 hypothetical protein [Niabella agricola]